jgi:UV DNA damage endonuclease
MPSLKLGLVCISEVLRERKLAFNTMTRKSFNEHGRVGGLPILSKRILHNTAIVLEILKHCAAVGISHYRMSSDTFPLVTDKTLGLSIDDLPDITSIKANLLAAGDYARRVGISISSHPSQFNVLASYTESVVRNTIDELNHQSLVLDLMGFSHDFSTPMCLHLSCAPKLNLECIDSYVGRFLHNLAACDIGVQSRLVLENEDKGFWNCERLHSNFFDYIPLVYDNLHDACNPSDTCNDSIVRIFRNSWRGFTPVFHWSEGIDGTNKHTGSASHIPSVVLNNPDVTWEVELKDKDYAILKILRGEL